MPVTATLRAYGLPTHPAPEQRSRGALEIAVREKWGWVGVVQSYLQLDWIVLKIMRGLMQRCANDVYTIVAVAEHVGVFAVPEISSEPITACTPFCVIATDGVWEFLSSQQVVDMVSAFTHFAVLFGTFTGVPSLQPCSKINTSRSWPVLFACPQVAEHSDPLAAAHAVVSTAHKLWLEKETRTDDITAIVAFFSTRAEQHDSPPAKRRSGTVAPRAADITVSCALGTTHVQ